MDANCLLSFLALSHKKNPRIFACKNHRILTQKKESEHVRIQFLRESDRFYYGNDFIILLLRIYTHITRQGFRIINKNPEFLAPSHGCVIQNRAIMRYTLFVV